MKSGCSILVLLRDRLHISRPLPHVLLLVLALALPGPATARRHHRHEHSDWAIADCDATREYGKPILIIRRDPLPLVISCWSPGGRVRCVKRLYTPLIEVSPELDVESEAWPVSDGDTILALRRALEAHHSVPTRHAE